MTTDRLTGRRPDPPWHLIVMGVSGCGKSTVGAALAARLRVPFAEGDDFHSAANRAKMAAGVALTDDDRWPWLASLRGWMSAKAAGGASTVVACSALRRCYRDVLVGADGSVRFALLSPQRAELERRMTERVGHYMPPSLLASQLRTLEPLQADEPGLTLDAGTDPDDLVATLAVAVADPEAPWSV